MTIWDDLRWPHILLRLGILLGLGLMAWIWYRSQKQRFLFFQVALFSILWVSLEFLAWAGLRWVWPEFQKPNHLLFRFNPPISLGKPPLYGDYDPDFDRWRLPADSVVQFRCDDSTRLVFRTNHLGMRDMDYPMTSTERRIVWLGDSFTEGVMVNGEDRASDLIERSTGIAQINFGIRSSSPINQYLIYKKFKGHYTHNAVVLGLLPANDFEDYHPSKKLSLLHYPLYRPYWTADRKIAYSLNHLEQAYGSRSRYNRPDLVYATRDSLYRKLTLSEKVQVEWTSNSYLWALIQGFAHQKAFHAFQNTNSFDQEVSEEAWQSFLWSFQGVLTEAAGKKLALVLYPTLYDIKAYQQNSRCRLVEKLAHLCKIHGVELINTLPHFAKHPSPESLYVSCDGHWNEAGEAHAAKLIIQHPLFGLKNRD